MPFGYIKDDTGQSRLAPYPSVTVIIMGSYPSGRGHVALASSDPSSAPLIACRVLGSESDVRTLASGVAQIRDIFTKPPLRELVDQEVIPGASATHDLPGWIRAHTSISLHPLGTCRMGCDPLSVVDAGLNVRGVNNLYVADASIIPRHMSANLNAVCIMIGKKLGKMLTANCRAYGTPAASPLESTV
jgi:choline dehydrogenase-like flavoprotein